MKPARFDYVAPPTLDEALGTLAEAPDETSLLAGGQSLVPMLNMRIARPDLVLDLRHLGELAGISQADGVLRIGAMTRQRVIETDADVRTALPLVPAALQHVAHVAIRTRGTIGGSLAHADPSAELPAAVIALEGRLHLRSTRGTRAVAADDFFIGALMTALEPGELIEAVELPVPPAHTGWGFHEIAATRGAFALAGAVAMVRVDATGAIEHARLALMGIGATTVVPGWLADTSRGRRCDEELLADIRSRLQESLSPTDDVHASAAYRRRAAATIAVRALRDAARRAGGVEA